MRAASLPLVALALSVAACVSKDNPGPLFATFGPSDASYAETAQVIHPLIQAHNDYLGRVQIAASDVRDPRLECN